MRYIDFEEPQNKAWVDWRRRCEEARNTLIQDVKNGQSPPVINKDLYKEMKVDIYMSYEHAFRGKCAYCERDIRNQYGDIDHYRPECSVTDIARKPVIRGRNKVEEKHPGYYWLAYEWKNLLPACEICNSPSKKFTQGRLIGKWDRFPIRGQRAWEPGQEELEEPLLINPVNDKPEEYLTFNRTGVVVEKNENEKGKTTIDVLGLNDNGLPDRRAERYNDIRSKAAIFVIACKTCKDSPEAKRLCHQLEKIKSGYGEFTIYALMAIEDERKAFNEAIGELPGGYENE